MAVMSEPRCPECGATVEAYSTKAQVMPTLPQTAVDARFTLEPCGHVVGLGWRRPVSNRRP